MKFFIGKKFNNKTFIGKKNKLEETMSAIGVKQEFNETEILSKIKEEICRNKISMKEVIKEMVKFNTLFLEDESQNIIAMLIFDINYTYSYIEIHYLCSMETYKGNGKLLLDKIKEYAKIAGIDKIILTPGLDINILNYYKENDFQEEGMEMIYNVKGGKTKRKLKNKKKKTRKIKKNYL
jgi:GNAT superfamily N-acetyltransferase